MPCTQGRFGHKLKAHLYSLPFVRVASIPQAQLRVKAELYPQNQIYIRPTLVETRLFNMEKCTLNPMARVLSLGRCQMAKHLETAIPYTSLHDKDEIKSRHQEEKYASFSCAGN